MRVHQRVHIPRKNSRGLNFSGRAKKPGWEGPSLTTSQTYTHCHCEPLTPGRTWVSSTIWNPLWCTMRNVIVDTDGPPFAHIRKSQLIMLSTSRRYVKFHVMAGKAYPRQPQLSVRGPAGPGIVSGARGKVKRLCGPSALTIAAVVAALAPLVGHKRRLPTFRTDVAILEIPVSLHVEQGQLLFL